MKTIYTTASSLDGFIADPDHSLEWLLRFGEPEPGYFERLLSGVGAIAMGSTTYQWILDHPPEPSTGPAGWPYSVPTWVFTSRCLASPAGADISFVSGDVEAVHREVAAVAGEAKLWIMGGGDLAGQFHDRGLLDEILVTVVPVTLGAGSPLLPRAIVDPPLRLLEARPVGQHLVDLHYEVVRVPGR
jgi:dihydrofolate reductase